MDANACNYNSLANQDDGNCDLPNGCGDPNYSEFNSTVTCSDASACITLSVSGCTNSLACNYNSLANFDDSSCLTDYGCTDSVASNYSSSATCDDSSCTYSVYISEYAEGSGYNKYIEIYNGTGYDLDLSSYSLKMIYNGGDWINAYELLLSGILSPGDVFIVSDDGTSNNPANSVILNSADLYWSASTYYFNGNDAIV